MAAVQPVVATLNQTVPRAGCGMTRGWDYGGDAQADCFKAVYFTPPCSVPLCSARDLGLSSAWCSPNEHRAQAQD